MEPELKLTTALSPIVSAQLRSALYNVYLSAKALAPDEAREKDPALDAKAAQMDQQYFRLLRLVNSLTSIAWMEKNTLLSIQNQDLIALVQEVFASAESLARLKGLEMRLCCPKDSHLCAFDRSAMEMLLYQLISNAMKYTPESGCITVTVSFRKNHIRISVADTGCGISQQKLDALFSLPQAETLPLIEANQGAGLSLFLCRRIAEKHGGHLIATTKQGKGSTFTLSLPDHLVPKIQPRDLAFDFSGGFNPALLHMADVLPAEAFQIRNQD